MLEQRTAPVASYYASWRKWLPVMKGYEARAPSYFATPAVQLIQVRAWFTYHVVLYNTI